MEKNTKSLGPTKIILIAIIGAVIILTIPKLFENQRLSELEAETKVTISEQKTVLATIAETTARNGADSVTEKIIIDCPVSERSSFDTLLGNLNNGLTRTQLIELERLFGRCGSFFAERKSVMVARLAREIEVYETFVQQLGIITGDDVNKEFQIEQWNKLAQEEKKQSELFSQLVIKQDKIISTLLDGKSANSPEIIEILREVKEVQETLVVTNQQVSNVRQELVSF